MNHNALRPPSPPTELDYMHMRRMQRLDPGTAYELTPEASLDGTRHTTAEPRQSAGMQSWPAAELMIPVDMDEAGTLHETRGVGIVTMRSVLGETSYAVAGLVADTARTQQTGQPAMKLAPKGVQRVLSQPGEKIVIGRQTRRPGGSPTPAERLWGGEKEFGPVTSREHVVLEVGDNGNLTIKAPGRNGTWANIGYTGVPSDRHHNQAKTEKEPPAGSGRELSGPSHETIRPSAELRFCPVQEDPEFRRITAPYEEQLSAVAEKYKAELARQELEYQYTNGSVDSIMKLSKIREAIRAEQAPIRGAYEQAVKPYLRARQALFRGDNAPGYAHEGQASFDRASGRIVSSGGKHISRPGSVRTQRGDIRTAYGNADIYPRLGQLLPPARSQTRGDATWEGNAYTNKKDDERGGPAVSSREYVVNMAAAMAAGTFRGSSQPIQYRRVPAAEANLPDVLRDKMNVYEIVLGMHRVQAMRLIKGNDAPLNGATEIDR